MPNIWIEALEINAGMVHRFYEIPLLYSGVQNPAATVWQCMGSESVMPHYLSTKWCYMIKFYVIHMSCIFLQVITPPTNVLNKVQKIVVN